MKDQDLREGTVVRIVQLLGPVEEAIAEQPWLDPAIDYYDRRAGTKGVIAPEEWQRYRDLGILMVCHTNGLAPYGVGELAVVQQVTQA